MNDIGKSTLNNSWSMLQRLMFTVLFTVFALGVSAQNKVTGTVVDVSGEAIIGASVMVKGTSNGTITDYDGNFTIQNVPQNGSLVISYVGYRNQTVAVAGKSQINVTL